MRGDHTPVSSPYALGDDGASTYIFDDFFNFYDGDVLSVLSISSGVVASNHNPASFNIFSI